jgi:hypothetical protein
LKEVLQFKKSKVLGDDEPVSEEDEKVRGKLHASLQPRVTRYVKKNA